MLFLLTNIILLLIIIFLFVALSMVWPPDSPWAPWWRTNKKTARAACRLASIKKNEKVYELGSGDAQFLITAAKNFGAKCTGIEIDPLRVLISRIKIKLKKQESNIKIIRKNFYQVNLADADVVFVYLVPKALERLKEKLKKELRKETRVVSLKYKIPYLPLIKKDPEFFLYLYRSFCVQVIILFSQIIS